MPKALGGPGSQMLTPRDGHAAFREPPLTAKTDNELRYILDDEGANRLPSVLLQFQ